MKLKDPHYRYYFDWISFYLTISITLIGLIFVYSATTTDLIAYSSFFKKQLYGACAALILYFFFCFNDYRTLCRYGFFLYFITMILLVYTLIKGKIGLGAQRWIDIGICKFQPSELAKLVLPPFFSYFLYTENDVPIYSMDTFIPLLGILFFSTVLILKQPDLGTAIVFFGGGLLLFWFAGIGKRFFRIGLFLCVLSAPLSWHFLKPYQKKRVLVFLGQGDVKKERYQIEQSIIAIGSGGTWGKGFKKGTQNKLCFLPEGRTDFIYSVLCEEWGFAGALLVIMLYLALFLRILYRLFCIPSFFPKLLGIGLLAPIMLSACINIGMVCGLCPVVGIPLPMISYGVTSLWITYASLGWIQGITMRLF